jgi:hypothetical protein
VWSSAAALVGARVGGRVATRVAVPVAVLVGALLAGLVGALVAVPGWAQQVSPPGQAIAVTRTTVVGRLDVHAGIGGAGLPERTLYVYVPAGYDTTQRYPVLYLQDGQDLFDATRAAGGDEWGLDELLSARPPGIPPLLVVGIEAAPDARSEYAPPGSGQGAKGDAYVRFVVETVKPYVDKRYATRREARWTWIGGAGGGGLAALYGTWTRPRVFGAGIALSLPDLDSRTLPWLRKPPPAPGPRLWIDQEGHEALAHASTTQLLVDLRRGARVDLHVASSHTARLVRLAAALRAVAAP